MSGVDDRDALVALYQNMIAKLAGVDPSLATVDDGSCLFGPQFAPRDVSGGSCMSGVDLDSDALVALYQNMIRAALVALPPSPGLTRYVVF